MSRPDPHSFSADPRDPLPTPVRIAGWISAAQGLAGVVVAVILIARIVTGQGGEAGGWGLAAWFVILGGGLMAAGLGLLTGRRWGRGLVLIAELLILVAVGSSLIGATGATLSGRVELSLYLGGLALAVACAVALVSLLRAESVEWYAR